MNRKVLFWPLAAMLLTACEKGLVDGVADVAPAGQAANSVLQVRTRSGGSAGGEATVAYPIAVYVFAGEECKAVQTIGYFDAQGSPMKRTNFSEQKHGAVTYITKEELKRLVGYFGVR